MLRFVPAGIGPRAFVVDVSRTHLPKPYSILQYLPGEMKTTVWSDVDLETHARTLARLHQRKFDRHGKFGRLTEVEFDILRCFEVDLHYWQTHYPELFDLLLKYLMALKNGGEGKKLVKGFEKEFVVLEGIHREGIDPQYSLSEHIGRDLRQW